MRVHIIRRKVRCVYRRFREAQVFARAMHSPYHPILAHIIPVRRCNLSCAYCNEYDKHSQPVPTAEMLRRVDTLAALGTTIITISGGEPLLHPNLEDIVRGIRRRRIIATLITNGYLLTPERIKRLNRAGLDQLQISIDNAKPDEISKKSLSVLDQKLRWLAEFGEFEVNINSVLGDCMPNPEDAVAIAQRALDLGFTSTVGIIHDGSGRLQPLSQRQRRSYDEIVRLSGRFYSYVQNNRFQRNLVRGMPNSWHCRAGGRYLYVCEDGLVHWCSQQRGYPGVPLDRYTAEDLKRECHIVKPCAPYCTISCVHQTAILDDIRERPRETLAELLSARHEHDVSFRLAPPLRILRWMFLSSNMRRLFGNVAMRVLRARTR